MDEAFSKVHVSTEVTNLYLNVSIVPQSNQTRKSILIGDTIQVMCSYDNPEFVNPPPNMRILMVRRENGEEADNSTDINLAQMHVNLDKSNSTTQFGAFNQLKVTKVIGRSDMNKQFLCECEQKFEDTQIYFNSIYSNQLDVFQPPTLVSNLDLPEHILVNLTSEDDEKHIIPLRFMAIPKPKARDISWTITNMEMVDYIGNDTLSPTINNNTFTIHPENANDAVITHPLKTLGNDVYEAAVEIRNATSNMTIILDISNEYGRLVQTLPNIVFFPRLEALVAEPQVASITSDPMFWVTVMIVAILIVSIVVFSFMVCISRKKKRQLEEDDTEKVLEHRIYQSEKTVMDHDNVAYRVTEQTESKVMENSPTSKTADEILGNKYLDMDEPDMVKKEITKKVSFNSKNNYSKTDEKESENPTKREITKTVTVKTNSNYDGIRNKDTQTSISKDNVQPLKFDILEMEEATEQKRKGRKRKKQMTTIITDDSYNELSDKETHHQKPGKSKMMSRKVTFLTKNTYNEISDIGTQTPPDDIIVRHSGPTNYPVMGPPPPNYASEKTPSRTTSPLHFTGPDDPI